MQKLLKLISLASCVLALHVPALAADGKGSADEAISLVKKAADFVKANGTKKAYATFNDPAGPFKDRDLYVFVFDFNGKVLAHGANPKLIDKDLSKLKDADDKLFVKDMIDVAKAKGKGWIDYKWPNPVTKAIEAKSTYVEKMDDVFIGCGVYK